MPVKAMIENELLRDGWGPKGQSVALVSADTTHCPRLRSGRHRDPNTPCGHRLEPHPTIRIPEGRVVECNSCGWLGVREHPEAVQALRAEAVHVVKLDATIGLWTLAEQIEFVERLFPALGLGPAHAELVTDPAEATVQFAPPPEAVTPKSEVEELRERLAKLEAAQAASKPAPKGPKKPSAEA